MPSRPTPPKRSATARCDRGKVARSRSERYIPVVEKVCNKDTGGMTIILNEAMTGSFMVSPAADGQTTGSIFREVILPSGQTMTIMSEAAYRKALQAAANAAPVTGHDR